MDWDDSQQTTDDSQAATSDADVLPSAVTPAGPTAVSPSTVTPAEPTAVSPSAVTPAEPTAVSLSAVSPAEPAAVSPSTVTPAELERIAVSNDPANANAVVTPAEPTPASPSVVTPAEPTLVRYDPAKPAVANPAIDSPVTPTDSTTVVPPAKSTAVSPSTDSTASVNEPNLVPETPDDVTPAADSSCSQARDVGDISDDPDTMEHDEYLAHRVSETDTRRLVRGSANPAYWRHQRRPKASICVFDAVDDGVCLAATGIIWSLDGRLYEIVLVASLGWTEQRNTRSHSVNYSNPIYIILRSATYQGRSIKFNQLKRIVASAFFREGRAHHSVHFPTISFALSLANKFVDKHQRDLDQWAKIKYLKTEKEKIQERMEAEKVKRMREAEATRKLKLRQQREQLLIKKRELAELKRKEQHAKQLADAAARKIAKAEHQKRARAINRQVKAAVLNACHNLESEMQKTMTEALTQVRGEIDEDMAKAVSEVRAKINKSLTKAVSAARSGIDGDYGVRLTQCEAALKELEKTAQEHKVNCVKKFKEIQKQMKQIQKQLQQLKREDKEEVENEPPPRKRAKQHVLWSRPPSALDNTVRSHVQTMPIAVQTLQQQPMMSTPVMYQQQPLMTTPQPQPAAMSTSSHTANPCRYISPVFGQRNFHRNF